MRHSPKHAVTDEAIVRRLIEEHPWATFISQTSAGLVASHYAVILDDQPGEGLSIVTHVGRPDDRIHELTAGHEILMIVQGPHGYISPSWYADGATRVSTWNFSAAHCYGTPQLLDADENAAVLTRMVAHFERHVDEPVRLDQATIDKFAGGTVGFRLPIDRFVCKVKMSADKDEQTQRNVLAELRGDGAYASPYLADDMERALAEHRARTGGVAD